jgi:uncharacterized membrane protein
MAVAVSAPPRVEVSSSRSVSRVRYDAPDLVRGIVMVVMLLDHTRDFTHADALRFEPTDLAQTTVVLFFTRWVTHYCAPLFVFLAGMSTAFQQQRGKPLDQLSAFLLKRGVWLCLLEVLVIRFLVFWQLVPTFLFLQVIWALGISMIVLAAAVRLPTAAALAIAVAIVAGHNALDGIQVAAWQGPGFPGPSAAGTVWMLLHQPGLMPIGSRIIVMAQYPVLPWIGVMLFGWVVGHVYQWPLDRRRRALAMIGFACTAAFVVVRGVNVYGDPSRWTPQPSVVFTMLSFLNTTKYPPSLDYVLMTVGPGLLTLAWFEGVPSERRGRVGQALITYGRVPLFFYVLQWTYAKCAGLVLSEIFGRDPSMYFQTFLQWTWNDRVGFPIWVTYAVWIGGVVILYFPCRWFAAVKARRRDWWLSYV